MFVCIFAYIWVHFYCRQSSVRGVRTFSRSRRKTSQQYAELTVWPAMTTSLWTIFLMPKKIINMLLTFSVSVSLDFPCMAHTLFPERLPDHCQGLRRTFSRICTKLSCTLAVGYRPVTSLQIKGRKKQHVHLAEWNFVSQDILVLSSTGASRY
jgi:hypothetical protein